MGGLVGVRRVEVLDDDSLCRGGVLASRLGIPWLCVCVYMCFIQAVWGTLPIKHAKPSIIFLYLFY